jgi:hypothetical protein
MAMLLEGRRIFERDVELAVCFSGACSVDP